MLHTAYLSLGSNLGDSANLIAQAYTQIEATIGTIVRQSTLYQTSAWGMPAHTPDFFNSAVEILTNLSAKELLHETQTIEIKLGRKEKTVDKCYQNRLIDLDILYYGQEMWDTDTLQIPHPHIQERAYVLEPLLEIAPDWEHPILLKTTSELWLEWKRSQGEQVVTVQQALPFVH